MTGDQILQTAGALVTGISAFFLVQLVLWLAAHPKAPKPRTTDKKAWKK
jgi:Na+-transporting NADH:ubiquinone oxidoreductase subunit NqrD